MNTELYTGNGSTQSLTGLDFQPDMVWFKSRTATTDHALFDVVRGTTKEVRPNKSDYEDTASNGLTAFNSNGSSIGDWSVINTNSESYVAWNWKLGGAAVANNDGSVETTVSANTTAGISALKWTANISSAISVGHGLGKAPKVIVQKALGVSANWVTGGYGLSWNGYLMWNLTSAFNDSGDASSGTGRFFKAGGTEPTSSVFYTNSSALVGSPTDMIAYCFTDIKGYSQFSNYTGNGDTSGPFVYCGFKPAWILIKDANNVNEWNMFDAVRSGNPTRNVADTVLWTNTTNTESEVGTNYKIDIVSNGFKVRTSNARVNTNGQQYIYMAFATNPFVANVDGGLPTTAR